MNRSSSPISLLFILSVLATLFVPAAAVAQPAQSAVVRIDPGLALVDFLAFDQSGKFVPDLRADEVQLFVDGKPEKVDFFQLADFRPEPSGGESSLGSTPGKEYTEIRGPSPIIFVFDLDSMEPSSLAPARESLKSFLQQPHQNRRLYMLFAIQGGLSLRCRLTDDPQEVLDAAELLTINRTPDTFIGLIEQLAKTFRTLAPARLYLQAMQDSVSEAKIFVNNAINHLTTFTEAATGLAHQLEPLPGRKSVVLYSSGYPVTPSSTAFQILLQFNHSAGPEDIMPMHILTARFGQLTDETGTDRLRAALRELNGSQTSVYAVNTARLTGEGLANSPESQYIPRSLQGQYNSEDRSSRKSFLERVSDSTDGLSSELTAFEKLEKRLLEDNSAYYVLGFRPSWKFKEGSFKKYEVKVDRPGISVKARSGYLLRKEDTARDTIESAFEFPEVFRDFPTAGTASVTGNQVSVQLSIPTQALLFGTENGKWVCRIRVLGVLVDSSGTWQTGGNKYSMAREFNLSLDKARLETLLKTANVTAPLTAQAPPGRYELILVTRQWPSGRVSTWYTDVAVPEPQ